MKHTICITVLMLLSLFFGIPTRAYAIEREADGAARLIGAQETPSDPRTAKLRQYLQAHNSPLSGEAETFVKEADKYDLDWRLVAAIAGTESTFGKRVPARSHNAWGWGIPTGARSGIGFYSWGHGIATVSRGLRENYVSRGATTVEQIGRIYAASPRWSSNVRHFIQKIDTFIPADKDFLAVSI